MAGLCEIDAATLALLDFDEATFLACGFLSNRTFYILLKGIFLKKLDFLIIIGLHVLRDFRLDVIQQHVLRNASFTVDTSSKLSSISAQGRLFLTALPNSSFKQLFPPDDRITARNRR